MVRDPAGRMGPVAVKGSQWVGCDDIGMIRAKSQYVMENGFGGGMIWALDLDDFATRCGCENYPLLKTMNRGIRNYPSRDPGCDRTNPLFYHHQLSQLPAVMYGQLPTYNNQLFGAAQTPGAVVPASTQLQVPQLSSQLSQLLQLSSLQKTGNSSPSAPSVLQYSGMSPSLGYQNWLVPLHPGGFSFWSNIGTNRPGLQPLMA